MDQIRDRLRAGSAPGPAYRKLAGALAAQIRSGEMLAGQSLPPERNLALDLGVSRVTVRAAYRALIEDGLVEVKPGSGSYVRPLAESIEQPLWRLSSFSDDMAERGAPASNRVLSLGSGPASPREASLLEMADGETVVRLRRLRIGGDRPLAVETAVLPLAIVGEISPGEGSLYAYLAERGFAPVRAVQRMRAVDVPDDDAHLLGIAPGSAAMFTERVAYLRDGRAVEYTHSHYRGDAYEFVAHLNTTESPF